LPQPLRDIMGWGSDLCAKAAPPTYPCLIDERHIVAQLYNMTNVPMAVWIDEQGHIVRPVEPTGASDGFRKMDRTTFSMPAELAEQGRVARMSYVDAVRDWVKNRNASVCFVTGSGPRSHRSALVERGVGKREFPSRTIPPITGQECGSSALFRYREKALPRELALRPAGT
jgi:hypothetical protein